jgi:hypothetical protein
MSGPSAALLRAARLVKVEPSPQAKQQTPQASDLDAVVGWELPTTG